MKIVNCIVCALFFCHGVFAQSVQEDYPVSESMMRSDLVKMEFQQQKAVFATLSPEVCSQLWKTKTADSLQSPLLENGEKAVLSFLYGMITPAAYDAAKEEDRIRFQKLTETAVKTLERYYDWSPSKVFRYCYTFMTEAEIAAYNDIYPEKIH